MPQIGDIGTAIDYDAGEDISDATVLKLKCTKPGAAAPVEWTAGIVGAQIARFVTTLASDLPVVGHYRVQLYLESPGWKGHGTVKSFFVRSNLS
jgi:hypothetical protein